MRIALVYPQFYPEVHWSTIAAQEKNLGVFPPLSLAYVAAILERSGHQVIVVDIAAQRLSLPQVIRKIKEFSPHLLGFTITTPLFHQNLSWIKKIKRDIEVPVIVGGVHVGLYPAETMSYREIDFAMRGDVEASLPEFMDAFVGRNNFDRINGLCFRRGSETVVNEQRSYAVDLNDIPFPARHLLPNDAYYSIVSRKKNFTAMITSRGCAFSCIFCDQGRRQPLLRSAANVAEELEECYHTYGIREVDFFDPSFAIDKLRVIEICKQIRNRAIDIIWSLRTRIDTVDEELLDEMSRSGCVRIMYGIESADPAILHTLRKYVDIAHIRKIIRLTTQKGIEAFGFFTVGNPGDTRETIKKTIAFARKSALIHAQFTRLTAFPGTELYKRYLDAHGFDYWRQYILHEDVKASLPLVDTHISIQEANSLVRRAYLSFYLCPWRIMRIICKIRSFHQFKKSVIAFFDMLFSTQKGP
jgi:anaerobic magnesium-protoporphyrin IX monomethyl ester cyclase